MNNYPHINALNLLGTPVSKRAQEVDTKPQEDVTVGDIEMAPRETGGADLDGSKVNIDGNEVNDIVSGGEDEQVKPPFMDRYRGFDEKGNLVITPSGIGGGLAGLGAMGGALLPGKDTPWWKRMIYSLLGAGALGTAGYFGGKYLGKDPTGKPGEEGYVPGGLHTGASWGYETDIEKAKATEEKVPVPEVPVPEVPVPEVPVPEVPVPEVPAPDGEPVRNYS